MALGSIHVGAQDNNAVDETQIWTDAVGDDRIIDF